MTKLSEKPELVVYSDASSWRGNLGAAAVILDQQGRVKNATQLSVGTTSNWSVHAAELVAVHYAIHMVRGEHMEQSQGERRQC